MFSEIVHALVLCDFSGKMRWGLENATSLTSNFLLLNSDETEVSGLDPKNQCV